MCNSKKTHKGLKKIALIFSVIVIVILIASGIIYLQIRNEKINIAVRVEKITSVTEYSNDNTNCKIGTTSSNYYIISKEELGALTIGDYCIIESYQILKEVLFASKNIYYGKLVDSEEGQWDIRD